MPFPTMVRYAGHVYPTVGWALGDLLLVEPKASDQRAAEVLNVTPQTVGYWRRKFGIPAYKERGITPYTRRKI